MQDLEDVARKIARLKGFGIRIAIDDFGTGYSSFSYLQRLPIDALKIDRSFVQDSGQFPGALSLLRAMNSLAKSLGLRVVVEGIETEAQLHAVREIGCDEAQGFLLGVPAPAGKTGLELLSEHLANASHSPNIKPGVELRVEPAE
jgi:EAL domain-containing protein (putative c-di-GMP-specific phosphodiesterase class I)